MEWEYSEVSKHKVLQGQTNTYLTNVGRGWDGELLSMDVEDHIRHLGNVVTVDTILRAEEVSEENERKGEERVFKLLVLLFSHEFS